MTDDENKDEANAEDEHQDIDGELMDNMEEFVVALNRFVNFVNSLEWPEEFPLDVDQKQCFSVFRTFWRQRERQRREYSQRRGVHMRFEGLNKEDLHRFFRNRFTRGFFDDDQPELNIDPEEHQPDEEHTDEAAKERQQRFRDEWE